MFDFRHKPWCRWLVTFSVYKLAVFGLAFVSLAVWADIWPNSIGHFALLLHQWDAKHILRVASQGYLAAEPSIQIFPVFPLLIRLFHVVLPGSWEVSAVIATQACSLAAFYYFYKLVRLDLDEKNATTALVLFAIFPTAYSLTAPYTESLFCALTFAAIYYYRVERFGLAATACGLAAATRYTGLLLAPALLAQSLIDDLGKRRAVATGAVALAGAAGFASYLVLNRALYGEWFYYMKAQSQHWGNSLSLPLAGAISAMQSFHARHPHERMSIIVMELGFTFMTLAMLAPVVRRALKTRQIIGAVYMGLTLFLLMSLGFWLSRPRYVLPLYPIFVVAAPWLSGSTIRLALYSLASSGLFAIYWSLYVNAKWAH